MLATIHTRTTCRAKHLLSRHLLRSLHLLPQCQSSPSWRRPLSTSRQSLGKRVSKKSLSDLTQGAIGGALPPLPPADKSDLRQDSLLQVVRNCMTKFPGCVVLTEVGNFYELYFEHAEEYGARLGLRVASKGKDGVAMAGFPVYQLERYLKMLVLDQDKKVAICKEFPTYDVQGKLETPIPRRVSRVVTAATLIDENFLDQDKNNFLLAIFEGQPQKHDSGSVGGAIPSVSDSPCFGLAWIDISTGELFLQSTTERDLSSALLRIGAAEVILSREFDAELKEEISVTLGLSPERIFPLAESARGSSSERCISLFDEAAANEGRPDFTAEEMAAAQQLFDYIDTNLMGLEVQPMVPQRRERQHSMAIDRSSIRGLELLKTSRTHADKGSLLNTIKQTVTQGGTRLLRERLLYPSLSLNEIEFRLNLVSVFLTQKDLHGQIVAQLRMLYDMHRIPQKFALGRGDADDLLCLATTIARIREIMELLDSYAQRASPESKALGQLLTKVDLDGPDAVRARIQASIDEEAVNSWQTQTPEQAAQSDDLELTNGGEAGDDATLSAGRRASSIRTIGVRTQKGDPWVMRRTASPELQALHTQFDNLLDKRNTLQETLRVGTGSPRLVLHYNSKYGHICHVPRTKGFDDTVLLDMGANRVGHLKTIRSYDVPEYTRLGRQMDAIEYEIRREEQKSFDQLRQLVVENLDSLRHNASVMDELDVASGFASLAKKEAWVRPVLTTKRTHNIIGGRHPTVKLGLQEQGRSFIANDLSLDSRSRAWLITGPNMAGKSTFLRQNALITILAQIGSYVPAEFAEIGIVDKIFSRIGATDDLFRNESTFMVEMSETAAILKDATDRSFVIMDEVGRGTAPEDGTAVAYASLHHLYNVNKCRTLFATHFHALADMTEGWANLSQHCTDVYEDEAGSFMFAHKLREGVNRKSHALKVAQMAGLPPSTIEVAKEALAAANCPQ